MLDWLERKARKSYTGVSIDFHKDGNTPQFRVMWYHHPGPEAYTLRDAIKAAIGDPDDH